MVVKRLELCHYQSMEQIVEITKNIAQNFKEIIHQFLTISRYPALDEMTNGETHHYIFKILSYIRSEYIKATSNNRRTSSNR